MQLRTQHLTPKACHVMDNPYVKAGMWLAPMVIGVLLWGGSITQTVAALSSDVKQHTGEIFGLSKLFERNDERLKGIERSLDRIEKIVSK